MNLFFYMPRPGGSGDRLLSAVAPLLSGGSLEVFRDLQGFSSRVRQPKDPLSVAIIWDPTTEDLRGVGSMRDFLTGVRTLLVLSDQEAGTIALAHRILPTYITYVDDGIPKIVSVLERLIELRGDASRRENHRQ